MFRFLRLLVLPLLTISSVAVAQVDFRPGYIIQPAGDTLRGEVDNRSAVRSATECWFRQGAGAVRSYSPTELLGYGLPGSKVYRSRLVAVPDSSALLPRTYFLDVLVAGATQLYYRRDSNGYEHFYVGTGPAAATELVYRRTLTTSPDGSSRYLEKNLFRGTLAETFSACPAVQQQVASLPFKQSQLVAIIKLYNACVGSATSASSQASAIPRSHVTIGMVAGLGIDELRITTNPGFAGLSNADFGTSTQPVGGLRLGVTLPRLSEKLSVQLEVLYHHQRYQNEYRINYSSSTYSEQTRVQLTHIKFPLLLRYTYPTGRVRPIVQAGIAANLGLKAVAEYRQQSATSTTSYSPWQPVFTSEVRTRSGWGPVASAGIQSLGLGGRLLTLEARTERSLGFTHDTGVGSIIWHHQVLLGVTLTK
ncbi:outer membrane beta-barrel protein [Hymenobacter elongatus]|nr:outer membrane beta-barrel protein [Hymenobacter elongatus]